MSMRIGLLADIHEDVERLQRECCQTYSELPVPFRIQVSPDLPRSWLDTVYPSAAELDSLREQATKLDASRRRLREAQQANDQWTGLKAQEAAAVQTLARLQADLPAQRETIRQDHLRLENQEQALDKELSALRGQQTEMRAELDRLGRERVRQDLGRGHGEMSAHPARA